MGETEDVEELKEVLSAISVFLKDLAPTIKDIMRAVLDSMSGEALGEDAGRFYKKLVEMGMREDEAMELTRKFLERKMAVVDVAKLIPRFVKEIEKREEEEERKE